MQNQIKNEIKRYSISGARRLSNVVWTLLLFVGSSGFLSTGFSCYFRKTLFPFSLLNTGNFVQYENIQFFPQGLIMIFYGFLGFFLSIYLGLTVLWGLGSGFNEFNKRNAYVRIFRWGFPGKNRRMNLYYSWEEILGIRVEFQQNFNAQYIIFLQIRGKKEIPLTHIGEPRTFEEIEKQASALAKFLQVTCTFGSPAL
uniref:Photosystem I assembly protein Ycf4 n=1 Tax=Pseudocodium devriesii TaxID=453070 RepID=A0A386B110_9CHLO|nr:photosystem I assembly protein Ycf4 [Pseudocodium devriesii]AYC65386.1 photosystem I assembly protein Ycf4 [Pseudocodium devriesii]